MGPEYMTGIAISSANPYLASAPDPRAKLRLFCFHQGGGSASTFAGWQNLFGPDISVVAIELPGHGYRFREELIADRAVLLNELNNHLAEELSTPYALYGQCMGGLVAYNLACLRRHHRQRLPECLFIGGTPAPPSGPEIVSFINKSDDELCDLLREIGTLSPAVMDNPEWCASAVAIGRADGQIWVDYTPDDEPLNRPLHAFVGDADDLIKPHHLERWRTFTASTFTAHTVPGTHSFNVRPPQELIEAMTRLLNKYI
jgi:surfactin synthase thioesterase subunit